MKVEKSFILSLILSLTFCSCSLKYNSEGISSSQSPEFVFNNPKYTRINNGLLNLEITASQIEQYSTDDSMYATNINFTLYDNKEKKSAEGEGKLLSANLEKEVYYLFDDIKIHSFEKNIRFYGKAIKWDNISEQLITEKATDITIHSEEEPVIKVEGTGFSANGRNYTYSFLGEVSGEIITKN